MSRQPRVGAYVLETLTTGMYTEPLDTVREFVQNAADSIRNAEESKLLRSREGRIAVEIDRESRCVTIRDNGLGVPAAEVEDRLLDIGMSDKRVNYDAGFRGIGRLAGIAYCNRLIFRATARGEARASTLELNCLEIRKAITPGMRRVQELADVMARHSHATTEKAKKADHWFEVVMDGVTESGEVFLDWHTLERYLSQVAPVDFDPQDFIFAPKIAQWASSRGLSIPTVKLTLSGPDISREILKPYRSRYKTSHQRRGQFHEEIRDIAFFPEDASGESPFWLWYGVTDLLGTIADDLASGLRFRKNNIQLGGPERVAEVFADTAVTNRRFNAWYVGEMHVLASDAVPNARRDGFEPTPAWAEVRRLLLPFVKDRCADAHASSSARNAPVQKLTRAADAVVDRVEDRLGRGIASVKEKESLLGKLRKEKTKAATWLEANPQSKDGRRVKPKLKRMEDLEKKLEHANDFGVKRIKSNLDRKQRKVLQEVLEVVHEAFEGVACPKRDGCYEALREAILRRYQTNGRR